MLTDLQASPSISPNLTHQFGVRPDALIGMDVLRQNNLLIDYKARTIRFGSPPALAHSAPLISGMRLPTLEAVMDKTILRLQVDTGFNGILVYGGRLRAAPAEVLNSKTLALGGGVRVDLASIAIRIGDWQINRVTVAITDDEPHWPARLREIGHSFGTKCASARNCPRCNNILLVSS